MPAQLDAGTPLEGSVHVGCENPRLPPRKTLVRVQSCTDESAQGEKKSRAAHFAESWAKGKLNCSRAVVGSLSTHGELHVPPA